MNAPGWRERKAWWREVFIGVRLKGVSSRPESGGSWGRRSRRRNVFLNFTEEKFWGNPCYLFERANIAFPGTWGRPAHFLPPVRWRGRNRGPRTSNGTLHHHPALMELGPLGARSTTGRSLYHQLFPGRRLGHQSLLFATTVY